MQNRPKPWKKKDGFVKSDVVGNMHIALGDGIYADTLNLMPRLQNQIRSMAAFDNPIFYKNKRLGYSNYNNFSAVYMGKDVNGYIAIPRGLRDNLILLAKEAGVEVETEDQREKGRPIRVSFCGDLKTQQDLAAHRLLEYAIDFIIIVLCTPGFIRYFRLKLKERENCLILIEKCCIFLIRKMINYSGIGLLIYQ